MKIVDVKWFTSGPDCIGIVLAQVDYKDGYYKAYIGCGKGLDENQDAMHIMNYGARFHYGPALFPQVALERWMS